MAEQGNWYYNVATGQVEHGMVSGFADRMGPYATEEEAAHALDIVAARNEQADAEDAIDDDWDE